MKNKNGFTLVELLAVIVILALLIIVAIPNAQKMSSKVKEKAYLTKIENIENAAKMYGENKINKLSQESEYCFITDRDKNIKYICEQGKIVKVKKGNESEDRTCYCTDDEKFPTMVVKIGDLAANNNISYDNKNQYAKLDSGNKHPDLKGFYDNVVIDPINDYVINYCKVYVYYKYNNVYAWFDRERCELNRKDDLIGDNEKPEGEYLSTSRLFQN